MDNKRFLVYRAKHNLTQEELAKRLGVSRLLINLIENDKAPISKIVKVKMDLLEKEE